MATMNHSHAAHAAHPNDPVKQREHMQVLDLVPLNKVTHTAVKSGNWSDPKTWKNGIIPPAKADVLIADGLKVTYDVQSNAKLDSIRVDGELDFATNKNTKLVIDNFVIAPDGTLTIGTKNRPIGDNVKAEILFADNGKIDIAKDPTQLGRGLVSHGTVRIHGEEKTTFLKVGKDPMAGDRTLTLEKVPKNWEVGDQLVLTGTHFQDEVWNNSQRKLEYGGTQDEEVRIAAINGNRITLDRALKYNHDTPKSQLKAYVTNFTRNIVFGNENPNAPTQERGHIMFMHSDNVDVRYAAFNELGRTDKSKDLDDFKLDGGGFIIKDKDGNPIAADPRTVDNRRARYSFHFHRTGTEANSKAAIAKGNAVWGSPGLGYVHHESHAIFEDNAAYDVFGAAFISESGNETGEWNNNIAIKGEGRGSFLKEVTRKNHDVGTSGVGFWFQGRIVENKGNVSANQREAGFVYSLRGPLQKDANTANFELSQIAKGARTADPGLSNIIGFENNEAFGSKTGISVFKSNPDQSHDVRSVLDGFKGWEIGFEGSHFQYTGKYTMKDWLLIQSKSKLRRAGESTGVNFGSSNADMVLNGAQIEGFQTGVTQQKRINTLPNDGGRSLDIGDFHFDYVDVKFANIRGEEISNFDPREESRISSNQLQKNRLRLDISPKSDLTVNGSYKDVVIYGTKVDSLGSTDYESNFAEGGSQLGSVYHWNHERSSIYNMIQDRGGYYTRNNGSKYFVIEELIADRASGDVKLIPVEVELQVPMSKLPSNAKNLGQYKLRDISVGDAPRPVTEPSPMPDHDHDMPGHDMPGHDHDMPGNDSPGNDAPGNDMPGMDPMPMPAPNPAPTPDPAPTPPAADPLPSPDPLPSQPGGQTIRIEAESMNRQTYRIESNGAASDGKLISLAGGGPQGSATTEFSGPTGTYNISVRAFDENDGKSTLSLRAGGKTHNWTLDKQLGSNYVTANNRSTHTIKNVSLVQGETLRLNGATNGGEYARVDFLEFSPTGDSSQPSNPAKPEPKPVTPDPIASDPTPVTPAPTPVTPDPAPVTPVPVTPAPVTPAPKQPLTGPIPAAPGGVKAIDFANIENHQPSTKPEVAMWGSGGKKTTVLMKGEGWQRLGGDYNITPDTVMEVEFRSFVQGGVQGIGFDNDKVANDSDRARTFRLLGNDQDWGIGVEADDITGAGERSYRIPVGQYFTGDYDYLTLINTQADGVNPKVTSTFKEIKLYEVPGIGESSKQDTFATGDNSLTAVASSPFDSSNAIG